MEITELLAIGVVGAFLSLTVDVIKDAWGPTSTQTKGLTILLSLLVGAGYVWIRSTPYFETALLILTSASAVYALKK